MAAGKSRPISVSATNSGCAAWGARLFFFVFFAAGAGFLWFAFGPGVITAVRSQTWPAATCTILSSEVKSHHSSDGNTHSVAISYRYEFNGRTYESDRYDGLKFSSSGRSGKVKLAGRYPVGAQRTCYVNPANPSEAVLYRGLTWNYLFALIPMIFIFIGGGGILGSFGVFGKGRAGGLTSGRVSKGRAGGLLSRRVSKGRMAVPGAVQAPMVLKAQSSKVGRLIASVLVCSFWNGIVGVFVYQLFFGHAPHGFQWFLALFLTPFVLIGLGMIAWVVHSILALANPVPQLRVEPGTPKLGETAHVQWRFRGNVGRISHLVIHIEAREEATYTVGTDTRTDKQVFHSEVLVDIRDLREMARGSVDVVIPANLMHSFESRHNKVVWELIVEGDIARWPDVKDAFKLEILP